METLIFAGLSALASFAGTWAAMRLQLANLQRDVTRAHKRLDLIGAPNVTLDA